MVQTMVCQHTLYHSICSHSVSQESTGQAGDCWLQHILVEMQNIHLIMVGVINNQVGHVPYTPQTFRMHSPAVQIASHHNFYLDFLVV